MNILFVASECAPFVKTGGLADVIGAVPKALGPLGANVRILLPAYPALAKQTGAGKSVLMFDDLFGGPARLVATRAEGLDLLLLDAPHLYERPGNIYLDENGQDWSDNHLRYGALCDVAAQISGGKLGDWHPDIVHAHDWQAGLVPLFIRMADLPDPPQTILTIHNIAFQGLFHWSVKDTFSIPDHLFTPETSEFWGQVGFLKAGLALSDKITTVSPTYARELLTPEFGMGLEGLLRARERDLTGILNGIDLDAWDPTTDPQLVRNYTSRSLRRKSENRTALSDRFALDADSDAPLFCVISRLTEQKGLDLLLEALPDLVERDGQLALLGSGAKELEDGFREASQRFAGRVGCVIGYDEVLSHLMQGGSDAILVPSRFEPCGLTQLYGLRYGTVPIVATTGGLADSVIDLDAGPKKATGVQFEPGDVDALRQAIHRFCDVFANSERFNTLQRNGMRTPVGWTETAPDYMALYDDLASARG